MKPLAAAALLGCAACALPVVTAGTFLPAGELKKGDLHASVSMEAGRVLAGPSDVERPQPTGEPPTVPPEASKYEVATWFASDASLRWQAFTRVSFEVQAKLTNPVVPFAPRLVGGSLGTRVRLRDYTGPGGVAIELGLRVVGVAVDEEIQRPAQNPTQIDRWNYRAWGLELPVIASYRVNPLFAVTLSPFVRLYWIRAWHTVLHLDTTETRATLVWTPVLSGGLGVSGALQLGPVEVAPGVAVELATRPGLGASTKLLFEPGLSVGTRW